MNEKNLIRKKAVLVSLNIGSIVFSILAILTIVVSLITATHFWNLSNSSYYNAIGYMFGHFWNGYFLFFIGIIAFFIASFVMTFQKGEMIISKNNVYGIMRFTELNIPINKISFIRTGCFSTIVIGTPAKQIKFLFVDSREHVYNCLSELLTCEQSEENRKNVEEEKE